MGWISIGVWRHFVVAIPAGQLLPPKEAVHILRSSRRCLSFKSRRNDSIGGVSIFGRIWRPPSSVVSGTGSPRVMYVTCVTRRNLSHSHTLTLSHSHTLTLSHLHTCTLAHLLRLNFGVVEDTICHFKCFMGQRQCCKERD